MNFNLMIGQDGSLCTKEFNISDLNETEETLLNRFCHKVIYDPSTHIGIYNGRKYVIDLIQDTNNHGEEENKRLQGNIINIANEEALDAVALYPICDTNWQVKSLLFIKWNYDVIKNLDKMNNPGVKVKLDEIQECYITNHDVISRKLKYTCEISNDLMY